MLFSGGMQRASYGDRHTITVMTKDKHVVFDFTSKVIDFFTVFARDEDGNDIPDNPEALIVLAEEEIVAIDLTNPQWKMMALPYLVSLHASAVNISICIRINFNKTINFSWGGGLMFPYEYIPVLENFLLISTTTT